VLFFGWFATETAKMTEGHPARLTRYPALVGLRVSSARAVLDRDGGLIAPSLRGARQAPTSRRRRRPPPEPITEQGSRPRAKPIA
jgi:hypothetical protein